jgi:hypothetical protein
MDFEQYLEKDIITFLDGKIDKKDNVLIDREEEYGVYLTKDYLKELSFALDNDELTRAKKLFDELKITFSRLPKHSVERRKTYALLEKMYEKIQNYVRIKEGKIEVVKQGDSEIFKDKSDTFQDVSQKMLGDKIKMSPELAKELESDENMELPIHIKKDHEQKNLKNKSGEEKKDKHKDNISVESKILDKENMTYGHEIVKDKDKSEKQKEDDGSYQSAFLKSNSETNKIILQDYNIDRTITSEELKEDIFDYIDFNTEQLNRLKTRVIKKLLEDLRQKLEETNDEQERNIDNLRKEIFEHMTAELNKIESTQKYVTHDNIEDLRSEILNKVYNNVGQIITSEDITADNKNKDKIIRYAREESTEPSKESESEDKQDMTNEIKDLQKYGLRHKYNDDETQKLYEEAIYTMFQNNYEDAARILQKILRARPGNKAAQIRLQECIEAIGNA